METQEVEQIKEAAKLREEIRERQEIKLTEEDIKRKKRDLVSLEIKSETLALQIEQLNKMIETQLPMKQARNNLMQLISEKEVTDNNIKVITRQIREKKINIRN